MNSIQIRALTCDNIDGSDDNPGGTGSEEAFRNLMLSEIAAHLADIGIALRAIAVTLEGGEE